MMRFKALLIAAPVAAGLLAAPAAHAEWHGHGGGGHGGAWHGGDWHGGDWHGGGGYRGPRVRALRAQSSGWVLPRSLAE